MDDVEMTAPAPKPVFLDSSALERKPYYEGRALEVKRDNIRFEFPMGLEKLRLIEECRALNCLDVSVPDNFDFMFDITMQMLTGKTVIVYFVRPDRVKVEVAHFLVTNRYMDLRCVGFIDEYPIIVNWLVEFMAGELAKKFPLSLDDIRSRMRARKEERTRRSPGSGERTSS